MDVMGKDIKDIIQKNKELTYKKGQLQELLNIGETQDVLKGKTLVLEKGERELLDLLIESNFNLDDAINQRFSKLAAK
tara:strand:+ start:698 stop:931 length:234 start_codon:yes stop_codon:yes gene_type:complete